MNCSAATYFGKGENSVVIPDRYTIIGFPVLGLDHAGKCDIFGLLTFEPITCRVRDIDPSSPAKIFNKQNEEILYEWFKVSLGICGEQCV